MEFWPADFRADSGTVPKKKRKDKESFRLNDQAVQQGSLGAATLTIGGSQPPQWLTVVEPCSKSRINCTGQPTNVFPATRPPPPKVPQVSVHQRAEQGVSPSLYLIEYLIFTNNSGQIFAHTPSGYRYLIRSY